jgi:signal transduction histidine kinase
VRKIATQLRPGVLDDLGLPAAVEWQARDFARRANLDLDLLVEQGLTVESSIATPVFRILQEMLTNVAEHAGATSICVRLGRRDGGLLMEVQDNGRGITKADMVRPTSLGLLGMRERALALGGELFITTEPGPGTRVSAVIPLRADSQRATQK